MKNKLLKFVFIAAILISTVHVRGQSSSGYLLNSPSTTLQSYNYIASGQTNQPLLASGSNGFVWGQPTSYADSIAISTLVNITATSGYNDYTLIVTNTYTHTYTDTIFLPTTPVQGQRVTIASSAAHPLYHVFVTKPGKVYIDTGANGSLAVLIYQKNRWKIIQ